MVELVCCKKQMPLPEYVKDYKANLHHLGIKHLALRARSVEDVRLFLINKGIESISTIQTGKMGRVYFFVSDPDGNMLEFMQDIL